jgi:8-oxo-dGTP diphosphatase
MTRCHRDTSGFLIGAFVVIMGERGGTLLCLREDLDIWNLPGGRVERGESPWKAVVREVNEETGLEVEVERLAEVYLRPRETEIAFSYVCRVARGEARRTWEAVEARYFALERAPERSNWRHLEMIRTSGIIAARRS